MDEAEVAWLMTSDVPDVDVFVAELVNRPAWHRQAACRGMETAIFFPARYESLAPAKAVCEGCPVKTECLDAGRADRAQGIWGGLSPRARMLLGKGAA